METATITAKIPERKKIEFYQVMESLQKIIKDYCNDFNMVIDQKNNLMIKIDFERKQEVEHNFYDNDFDLLKGTIKSLCDNVVIKINEVEVS
jgi:hypothetical protein